MLIEYNTYCNITVVFIDYLIKPLVYTHNGDDTLQNYSVHIRRKEEQREQQRNISLQLEYIIKEVG